MAAVELEHLAPAPATGHHRHQERFPTRRASFLTQRDEVAVRGPDLLPDDHCDPRRCRVTRAQGKTLIAVVDRKQLGGMPQPTWGYQVLMQSNEGFPAKTDLLTRKVNEFEGQHRFGGGSDYDNDPHVMDILVPAGGDPVKKQHEILSKYNKAATTDVKPEDLAVVPMVYPCAD